MKIGARSFRRRSVLLAAAGILAVVLTACTGRGGGYLPPQSPVFTGPASLGFTFSCEDKGGINPQTGQLAIELAYLDKGSNPIGSSFSIHGIVDVIDPVLESAVCIGSPPPLPGNKLIFLGRYYLTSSAPSGFPSTCPKPKTATTLLCRFEVQVQDNDGNMAPSAGDYFSIQLSSHIAYCDGSPLGECSQLPAGSVFYTRAGLLAGGNITVK